MTPEVGQPVEPTLRPVEDKFAVFEKEMGRLNILVSAGFYEAICPEVLPELYGRTLSEKFLVRKRIEAGQNAISILRRTASQCPEQTNSALEAAASINKFIAIELSILPSTKLSPEQLAIAANGNMGELLETATKLGLPELVDPARFPLLGSLTPESLALLRSEAYVGLVQRLRIIRGEIARRHTATGFLSEGSRETLNGIERRIASSENFLLGLNLQ